MKKTIRSRLAKFFYKLSTWYFTKQAFPYWCVLFVDCVIVFASLLASHVLNFGLAETVSHLGGGYKPMLLSLLIYVIMFRLFHTYEGVVRYSSFIDLFRVAGATLCACIIVVFLHIFTQYDNLFGPIHIRDLVIGSVIATFFMFLMRIFIKVTYDLKFVNEKADRVMIFGTQEGGVSIAKSIRSQHPSPYKICGFITHLPDMMGHSLMNMPVLSATDEKLWDFIENRNVKGILISPMVQDFFVNECQTMISRFIAAKIKIMMMPVEQEWDGKTDISHLSLRSVGAEDLLPRDKIEIDMIAVGEMLRDKCILITGAAGSIGSEMVRQIAKFEPKQMILIDQAETPMHDIRLMMDNSYPNINAEIIVGSICNQTQMEAIFEAYKPEYVFHAAAYKHVPMMEDNPAMAVQNNVYGTRVIADLAVKYGTKKFVMISTDKAVNPTNVMGCSKRICEIYCQSLNAHQTTTQFVTTRFGNVLGSNGSVIPIFKEQILHGGPVTVTHKDIIRYFMLIPEACRLVLEAGTMGKGGEIFVFDMGKPVRIADLAQRMIDLMGAKDVKIVYTGLRDGEKLYEELLGKNENDKPTVHPKIMVASVPVYPYDDVLRNEQELYELSFTYDDMAIVRKMKEIVPEYKSQHSKFQRLDKE